jgi:hypothetical protein
MYQLPTQPDENHEFAFSEAYGGEIHISKVIESGRHDFICLGCKKPMLAILRKIYTYKPYFRHDVRDVERRERCTYRDDDHRRKIALTELYLYKQIHVPPLYKLPPKGAPGLAIPLLPGETIYGVKVAREQYFHEDEAGDVQISSGVESKRDDLLYYADAVFYNADDEPFLLVVFSDGKRKKRDVESMAGLARLRINTVQFTIPKESPEAIQNAIRNGKNTKWLYHDKERQSDYFSLSGELPGGIPATDVDQGQLFAESFDCRKVQINNLIRAINRCLASERYRTAERGIRTAIGETQLAISRSRERRGQLEEQYLAEFDTAHSRELSDFSERRSRIAAQRAGLSQRYQDLESRYRKKASELEDQRKLLESNLDSEEKALRGAGRTTAELKNDLEHGHQKAVERMGDEFKRAIRSVEREQGDTDRNCTTEGAAVSRIQRDIGNAPDDLARRQSSQREDHNKLEATANGVISDLQKERDSYQEQLDRARKELTAGFDELRRRAAVAAQNENANGGTGLAKRLKALIDARGLVVAVETSGSELRKLQTAKAFLGSPAFQTWLSEKYRG